MSGNPAPLDRHPENDRDLASSQNIPLDAGLQPARTVFSQVPGLDDGWTNAGDPSAAAETSGARRGCRRQMKECIKYTALEVENRYGRSG